MNSFIGFTASWFGWPGRRADSVPVWLCGSGGVVCVFSGLAALEWSLILP